MSAVQHTRLFELERRSGVTIVVPRLVRRLARVLHAFDPLSPTLLCAMTGDQRLGPGEQTLGLPSSLVLDTLEFLILLEQELDRRHIPYSLVAGDQLPEALAAGGWTVVLSCSAIGAADLDLIERALARGQAVTLGPHAPERDLNFQPLGTRPLLHETGAVVALLGVNQPAIAQTVDGALVALGLPRLLIDTPEIHGSLFETGSGIPSVAFLVNPTPRDLEVSWSFATRSHARDAITNELLPIVDGALRVPIPCCSVRMLELGSNS